MLCCLGACAADTARGVSYANARNAFLFSFFVELLRSIDNLGVVGHRAIVPPSVNLASRRRSKSLPMQYIFRSATQT